MARLVAAVGLLADWPFEVEPARMMVTPSARAEAEGLAARLFSQWKESLQEAGLWNEASGQWTRDLIEKRARQSVRLSLSGADASVARLGLACTLVEFRDNWGEFCVVGTGALQWYPVGPSDSELEGLSARFAQMESD